MRTETSYIYKNRMNWRQANAKVKAHIYILYLPLHGAILTRW